MDMGQLEEAGEKFRRVIELSPEEPAGYFCYGCWLMRRDRNVQAINYLNKALHFDPTYPCAHLRLGEIYHSQRNRAEARKHLRAELLLRPKIRGRCSICPTC